MKKKLVTVLCFIMALCLFVACGENNTNNNQSTTPDGKTVITIGLPVNMKVEEYETNSYTLWLEETTGHDLKFVTFAATAADYKSQIATRLDDLPDILWNCDLGAATYRLYGEDGYILDLTEYFEDEELSKPFWDSISTLPEDFLDQVKRDLVDRDTGMILGVPTISYSSIDPIDYNVYINKNWLQALNLKAPTSTQELYDVLVAFRDQDPNGNNQKDEIPIMGFEKSYCGDVINWIVNMFIYADDNVWWNVDENGQLYSPFTTDAYREALKFIKKLNDEGLLPGETTYTGTHKNIKSYLSAEDTKDDVGIFVGGATATLEAGCEAMYYYQAMPMWGCAVFKPQKLDFKTFITDSSDNPRAAFEVLMAMCSYEGSIRMRYGVKDVDWKYADTENGAIDRMSGDEVFTAMGNTTWGVCCAGVWDYPYMTGEGNEVHDTSTWDGTKNQLRDDFVKIYHEAAEKNNPKVICPKLTYTTEEAAATESIRANVQSYIKQCRSHFGVGLMNPDSNADWQTYLDELQNMGIETWRGQCQGMYEEQK